MKCTWCARIGSEQWSALSNDLGQIRPFNVFHDEKVNITRLFGIVGGHDVRMRKPGSGLHLTTKPFDRMRMRDELSIDEFQRHQPVHELMFGLKHFAHAAPPQ